MQDKSYLKVLGYYLSFDFLYIQYNLGMGITLNINNLIKLKIRQQALSKKLLKSLYIFFHHLKKW